MAQIISVSSINKASNLFVIIRVNSPDDFGALIGISASPHPGPLPK